MARPIHSFGPETARLLEALDIPWDSKVRKVTITLEAGCAAIVQVDRFLSDEHAEEVTDVVTTQHLIAVRAADGHG